MGSKLDAIMDKVNKDVKEEAFTKGMPVYEYQKVPFTSPKMNYITYGGVPLGRLIEFYGEEGGGKTTTSLDLVANFQNTYPDKEVLYVDAENTLDIEWARKIGVDVDSIRLYQPKTESAEYIFQVIKDAVATGEVGMWVLDSIPCLTAEKDLGKELTDDARVGGISGTLTRFCREITGPCAKNNCMGIFINQLRDKINSTIPGQTNTPGGRALKHFCTTRIQFTKGNYLDENGKTISRSSGNPNSQKIMVNMVKTKFCRPDRHVGMYTVNFDLGIDYITDLIDQAIYFDIIEQSGAWYSIIDIETGESIKEKLQGQKNVYSYLDDNPDVMQRIEEMVDSKLLED
jgi:recombination protein RecA